MVKHLIAIHFIQCYTTFYKLFYIILYFYLLGITLFCRFAYIIKNLIR